MNKPIYPKCSVPAAEVARIKGLGFLRDKTTEDSHCERTGNNRFCA